MNVVLTVLPYFKIIWRYLNGESVNSWSGSQQQSRLLYSIVCGLHSHPHLVVHLCSTSSQYICLQVNRKAKKHRASSFLDSVSRSWNTVPTHNPWPQLVTWPTQLWGGLGNVVFCLRATIGPAKCHMFSY